MRDRFMEQLQLLNNDLIYMGALCEDAIACAVKALETGDRTLAKQAVTSGTEVGQRERDVEDLCLKLLLQQQPVAGDLRLVSTALKLVTDMARIGDQAGDIAELAPLADLSHTESSRHISDMAAAVIKMVMESIDAFVKGDEAAASQVIAYDDVVDKLFVAVKKDLTERIAADPGCGESALDTLMIAKYLERIGDHAVSIAGWAYFAATGKHIDE